MAKAPEKADRPSSQKVADKFAPINATDRSSATRNFSIPKKFRARRFGPKKLGLSIGFIVIVMIFGTLLFRALNGSGEDSAANEVKSVLSNDENKEYRSAENKFSINFPGFPSIKKSDLKDGDKQIPQTLYERRLDNNATLYEVSVTDYSGVDLIEKAAMEVKLNERIQNLEGAKLESSKPGTYAGLSALEAQYSYSQSGTNYQAKVRFVVKDSRIYAVTLVGRDQAKFEEFANSLRLD